MKRPMISIVITTINREKMNSVNYFFKTWDSLTKSGGLFKSNHIDNIVISVGEPSGAYSNSIQKYTNIAPRTHDTNLTVVEHTHEAFKIATRLKSKYTILIQDDVQFAPDFILETERFLLDCDIKNVADMYTLYTPYKEVSEQAGDYWEYDPKLYYSLACVAFKQEFLLGYMASKYFTNPECYNSPRMVDKIRIWDGADMRVKLFAIDNKKTLAGHCPNIATHIGVKSSILHDTHFDKEFRDMDAKNSCLKIRKIKRGNNRVLNRTKRKIIKQ